MLESAGTMHYNHTTLNSKGKEHFSVIKEAVMKKLERQLRILLITQISIWLKYGLSNVGWSACCRYLAQLKQNLAFE